MYKIELAVESSEKLLSVIENLDKCEFSLSVDFYSLPKKKREWNEDSYPDIVLLSSFSMYFKDYIKDNIMYKIELIAESSGKLASIIENLFKCEFSLNVDIYYLPKKEMEWVEGYYPDIILLSEFSRFLKNGGRNSI